MREILPGRIHEACTHAIRERLNTDALTCYFDPARSRYIVTDGGSFEWVVATREGEYLDASRNHDYIVRELQARDLTRRRIVKRDLGASRILSLS
jgi:hypothetical protein